MRRGVAADLGARVVADGWVLPHFAERRLAPAGGGALVSLGDVAFPDNPAPSWTVVGAVGSRGRAAVDPRGLVTLRPGGWSLDWWVGADDGWHLPSREPSVRQEMLEGSGVVESAVRVPSGEVRHRAYAVTGGPDLVVVEIENASPGPVAVALAVRPFDPLGLTGVRRVEVDGTIVRVDGHPALTLPREAGRVAVSTLAAGDCARAVMAGTAEERSRVAVDDPDGMASAAVLLPLAHRASLRVAMPAGGHRTPADVAGLPSATAVARAWASHLASGTRVSLPDERSQRALDLARTHLLLLDDGSGVTPVPWGPGDTGTDDAVAVVTALERWGFGAHAGEVALSLPRRHRKRRLAPLDAHEAWPRAAELLDAASPTVTWRRGASGHHGTPLAHFLLAVRDGLVAQQSDGTVDLVPALPDPWVGRSLEVRRAPIDHGLVSFALRWHGEHVALLWEVEGDPVVLRAPGLDPEWSSAAPSGEALLTGALARPGDRR